MTVEAKPAPAGGGTARRTLTALVGIPLFLVPLYLGEWVWTILLVIIALLGAGEWIALTRRAGLVPAPAVVFPGTVLIYSSAVFRPDLLAGAVALLAMTALLAQLRPAGRHQAPANAGVTALGPLYLSLFAALDLLRRIPDSGLAWTILVVISVWVADSAAYFGGRTFGRNLLAPVVSPKKTWEGAISGEAGGIAGALVAALIFHLPLGAAAAVGALSATVGLIGDLSKSAIKRAVGVKDSGTILPGHGGVIDRFDAMLFVAPVAYALLVWVLR